MSAAGRVSENLNAALHAAFAAHDDVYLVGEDVLDPYGGAFKITRGLSTRYPERVITTPISEAGLVGVANGLALCGDKVIAEIMFGDFIGLAFDQIVNFAAKTVTMYGRDVPVHLVLRCPVGGRRGYGPTHSQNLQKHFIGVPQLGLFEVSPFHDNVALLDSLLRRGEPSIVFEDKLLYTQRMYADGAAGDLLRFDYLDDERNYARIYPPGADRADSVVICPGGLADRALAAARKLFLELEIGCQVIVPSRLHPFDPQPLAGLVREARQVCVAEEGTADGTWGESVAQRLSEAFWESLRGPVRLVHSRPSIIPASVHLESAVIVQAETIYQAVVDGVHA
jgi:pyruvate/2-oxoglutarate/acetoin dehydrogenase E1 component